MEGSCRRKYKNDEKEESQDRFLRNAVFQMANPALFAVTNSKGKTSVSDKLHDYSDHALIEQKSQQLVGKAKVLDSVICRCQIDKSTKKPRCFLSILDPRLTFRVETQPGLLGSMDQ